MTQRSNKLLGHSSALSRYVAGVLFLTFGLVTGTQAIDLDSTQPIQIESDSAIIDDTQGRSEYSGNVLITQGSTRLEAEHISVSTIDRSISQIVARGKPARFKQQSTQGDATTGEAEQITFIASDSVLVFNGAAKLSQTNNSFSGERIEYDIMQKAIRAQGDESTGTRVKIQYFPNGAKIDTAPANPDTNTSTSD